MTGQAAGNGIDIIIAEPFLLAKPDMSAHEHLESLERLEQGDLQLQVRLGESDRQFRRMTLAQQSIGQSVLLGCLALSAAIVGASGSGKTTLLQMVNALEQPDRGCVQVFGEPIPQHKLQHLRHRIGYAVQGAGLFPHLSARDNVVLVARLQGWSEARIQQRFEELLEAMALPASVAERPPRELSGGQQQRLGLCRALMLEPDLLLLDEPFRR